MSNQRRGIAYIAPAALDVPVGRMVDPEASWFWVSWQDDDAEGLVEDTDVLGADAAIAWGLERSEPVYIRLGHPGDTYFSAGVAAPGEADDDEPPSWPPTGAPLEGWFKRDPDNHR